MFTVPFIAFFLSEEIEPFEGMKGSGVVAVVVAAFYLTYRGPVTIKPQTASTVCPPGRLSPMS